VQEANLSGDLDHILKLTPPKPTTADDKPPQDSPCDIHVGVAVIKVHRRSFSQEMIELGNSLASPALLNIPESAIPPRMST
jgi:hypothetical protein